MITDRSVRLTSMDCSRFQRRVVRIDAGCSRPYDESEWDDALVIVTAGVVELEGLSGRRRRFSGGAGGCFRGVGCCGSPPCLSWPCTTLVATPPRSPQFPDRLIPEPRLVLID